MGRLAGRVAIVTGASRGIGEAIARLYAREGAKVVIAARAEERLRSLAEEIAEEGGEAHPVVTDVARTDDLRRMVEAAAERFGGLDILVNNAGITRFSRRLDEEGMEAEYDLLMATNLKSAFMAMHYAVPLMRRRGGGSILHISSVHGLASGAPMSAYAASKGALIAGTRAMALELAPDRIRVNCISPGCIWVREPGQWLQRLLGEDLMREFRETFGDWLERSRTLPQPLPVAGMPEDVAWCAVYLASEEARFVTGANFVVDGGMTATLSDPSFLHPGAQEVLLRRSEVKAWIEAARRRAASSNE
jgi:NAD(P)-dependent dehydrogenase (short-subunit alcohol dehydrogenase family)